MIDRMKNIKKVCDDNKKQNEEYIRNLNYLIRNFSKMIKWEQEDIKKVQEEIEKIRKTT
jgi:hypothetical protein